MKSNVRNMDRLLRGLGALALLVCAWAAPLTLVTRLAVFGLSGVYMMFTALAGTMLRVRSDRQIHMPLQRS